MGVKFAWSKGPLLHAKFHPHRCNDKGVGPPKLKFLVRFDRNVEYERPAEAYHLRDFHKICRLCTSFQDALTVKIWLDLLKGLWGYGGEIWHSLCQISPQPCNVSPLQGKRPQNRPLSNLTTITLASSNNAGKNSPSRHHRTTL